MHRACLRGSPRVRNIATFVGPGVTRSGRGRRCDTRSLPSREWGARVFRLLPSLVTITATATDTDEGARELAARSTAVSVAYPPEVDETALNVGVHELHAHTMADVEAG